MSNNNSLFKNLTMLSSSLGLGMTLGMFLRLYLPRVLGVEVIGQHYYALSIASLACTFFTLGIPNYIYKYVPVRNELRRTHFSTILNFELIYAAFILTAISTYLIYFNSTYKLPIIFLCMYLLSYNLYNDILKPFMFSLNKVKYMSVFDVCIKAAQLTVIVVVLSFYPTLEALCICYAVVWLVGTTIALFGARNTLEIRRELDGEKIKNVLIYCSPFIIASALHSVYGYIDIYIMGNLSTKLEVSYYGTVKTLEGILCFVLPVLIQGLSPYLSKALAESKHLYDKRRVESIRYVLGLVLCIGLGFIVMGREIIYYLYGSDFLPGLKIVPFCAMTLLLTYLNGLLAIYMNMEGKGKVVAYTTLMSVVINGGLNLIFIPYFSRQYDVGGAGIGAALTTNISEFCVLIGFIYAMGLNKFGYSNFIRFVCMLLIFIAANFYHQSIYNMSIGIKFFICFFSAPLFTILLGCFQRQDLIFITKQLRNRLR